MFSLFCLAVLVPCSSSYAVMITDNYVGGVPNNASYVGADVIGDANGFSISSMDVSVTGTDLVVTIYSNYFDNVGLYQTALGDLFISDNGWNPYGAAPYINDDAAHGEVFEYAAVLSDHGDTGSSHSMIGASGTLSLYSVVASSVVLSSAPGGYIYRAGQEVQYNPGNQQALVSGTWSISDIGGGIGALTFVLPVASIAGVTTDLGFHWAMSCANDVIEGAAPIPEPTTFVLFTVGLLGLAMRRCAA